MDFHKYRQTTPQYQMLGITREWAFAQCTLLWGLAEAVAIGDGILGLYELFSLIQSSNFCKFQSIYSQLVLPASMGCCPFYTLSNWFATSPISLLTANFSLFSLLPACTATNIHRKRSFVRWPASRSQEASETGELAAGSAWVGGMVAILAAKGAGPAEPKITGLFQAGVGWFHAKFPFSLEPGCVLSSKQTRPGLEYVLPPSSWLAVIRVKHQKNKFKRYHNKIAAANDRKMVLMDQDLGSS